jgi:hypothetical protein
MRGREGMNSSTRTRRVRANASVLSPSNFTMDIVVRPSHERPSGHCLTVHLSVRPSDIVPVTTLGQVPHFSNPYPLASSPLLLNVLVFSQLFLIGSSTH